VQIPRIFQNRSLQLQACFFLTEEASHHVKHVLRMKKDDLLSVFNGQGGEFKAVITQVNKTVEVCLQSFENGFAASPLKIILAQAISRGDKMDFTLQKAVELGVHTIIPLITERVNVRLDEARQAKRLLHWRKVMESATEQSGRCDLPILSPINEFSPWLETISCDFKVVLDPHAKKEKKEKIPLKELLLLVGPEGGLSEKEYKEAYEAGFVGWRLGPRILRTETAGMSAIAILQFLGGDFHPGSLL